MLNEGQSVAFKLAKEGYDVWMGNNRGNVYSRGHERLNPKGDNSEQKEYFDFSFYEMGKYDLPAMIGKALEVSGAHQVSYMGHSQGTTQMFSALSEDELLQAHINIVIALAPIAKIGRVDDNTFFASLARRIPKLL
jgi:predicted alpha/beta hydrolase